MDCYIDRPNAKYENGKYAVLDSMCFTEIMGYYSLAKSNYILDNDYQPGELTSKVIEKSEDQHVSYPRPVPLISSNEKLLCRTVPSVLQYHILNINTHPKHYNYHMLVLFYLFRREDYLMCGIPPSYSKKFYNSSVPELVNRNQSLVKPYTDLVPDAFQRFNIDHNPALTHSCRKKIQR